MRLKNVLSVCAVYLATVIGAGFATGQEISVYFVSCGVKGFLGIIIAALFIAFCCYSILTRVLQDKITSYPQYLQVIMPKKLSVITEFIVMIFLLCGFCVMITAGGTVMEEHYGISKDVCCPCLCLLCFFIFIRPIRFLVRINAILAPLIIIGIFIAGICIIFLREESISVFSVSMYYRKFRFLVLSLLYISYNLLLTSVILVSLKDYICTQKSIGYISVISGCIMFSLLGLIFAVIKIYYGKIELGQIPMLTILARLGNHAKTLYALVLLLAIFTTAIGNGYGFIDWFSPQNGKRRIFLSFLLCMSAILLSRMAFSNLVKYLFGAFGICGLYLLLYITIDGITLMISVFNQKQTKKDKK